MLSQTEKLLSIIKQGGNSITSYFLLSGSNNKIWLIPQEDIRTGLLIYQPSSLKGKSAKELLPYVKKFRVILKLFHIEQYFFELSEKLQELIKSIVKENNIRYSLYIGDITFANNRKVILQIMSNGSIKGYAKFTNEECVKQVFLHEVEVLNWLREIGIKNIPKVLWNGTENNVDGFIQTTEKSGYETTTLLMDQRHWEFLKEINSITGKQIFFRSSPYRAILIEFEEILKIGNWKCKYKILEIIGYLKARFDIEGYIGSFFHGDFTPWNICVKQDHIFVFDFEYARYDFPQWMDAFHFITQVAIMSDRLNADEIYRRFIQEKSKFSQWMAEPELYYLCYLLYILYFYQKRWKGKLPETEKSCNLWINLVDKIGRKYLKK